MDALRIYQYWSPGRLIFGPGAVRELKNKLKKNEKPLVVTDEGVSRSGILGTVIELLVEWGIGYELFDAVKADPSIELAEEAAAFFRGKGCTSVIGLGGGSSIDTAKAVAIGGRGQGGLRRYTRGEPFQGEPSPIYAIPTTAGTGSEVTPVAVLSDFGNKVKVGIKNDLLVPRVALLDPHLLATIPPRVAAETGADALSHAVEAYLSVNSHVITDALALSAIRMITINLEKFVANPQDVEAAGQMLLASSLAGLSFANAGLGLVHGLAHSVGAYFHMTHGLSCALYLPAVMEFNAPACLDKFRLMAEAFGADVDGLTREKAAVEAVRAVRDLFRKVALPKTFSEMGIEFKLDPKMVDDAYAAPPTKGNPRKAEPEQISALFLSVETVDNK